MRRFPGVVLELRTARAWGVPLGTIRRGKRKWAVEDRLLALALQAYEDGLCGQCGQPRDRAWNEDSEGWYTAHRATCHACRARELDADHRPVRPSEHQWITDDSPEGWTPDPRMAPR